MNLKNNNNHVNDKTIIIDNKQNYNFKLLNSKL